MFTLRFKDNGLFLDTTGKPCTRLNAIQIADQKTAYQYLDMYYLMGGNSIEPIHIVPYPKVDNEALQKEWVALKYNYAIRDEYADKISATFIIG